MSIRDRKSINVLNYNDNTIIISTKTDGYAIPPCSNDVPSTLPLTFDEIAFVNSHSDVFKTGLLRFEDGLEKEVYDELKIVNWKSILTNGEIENILLNPSVDGLSKIVAITNVADFDRVRCAFTRLKNAKTYDVSMRVESIVNERDSELRRGVRNTGILIKASDTEKMIQVEDVNELKAQLKAMQEMMNQMMANQVSAPKDDVVKQAEKVKDPIGETTAAKKSGRSSAKK